MKTLFEIALLIKTRFQIALSITLFVKALLIKTRFQIALSVQLKNVFFKSVFINFKKLFFKKRFLFGPPKHNPNHKKNFLGARPRTPTRLIHERYGLGLSAQASAPWTKPHFFLIFLIT